MLIVICISIIAVVLTWLDSVRMLNRGMAMAFTLLAALVAVHYDFGNDYMMYYIYHYLPIYDSTRSIAELMEYGTGVRSEEFVWALILKAFTIFGSYGFFVFVAVAAVFENYIFYRVIKDNVARKWWWFAIFIYVSNVNLYVISFSMMRQFLTMTCFLGLFSWIRQKKIIPCLVMTVILSLIHSSAIVILPFMFLGFLPRKYSQYYAWGLGILFVLIFTSSAVMSFFTSYFEVLGIFNLYMESYGDETSELTYGIGYLVNLIPFGLCLYDMCKNRNITQTALIVFVISSMAYEISPFGRLLPMISRTAFYFQAYYILAFPRAYSYVKSNMIRNFALAIFVVMSLVSYHRFLVDPTFVDSYSTFHTIFEAL